MTRSLSGSPEATPWRNSTAAAAWRAEVGRDPDPETWHLDVLAEAAEVIG